MRKTILKLSVLIIILLGIAVPSGGSCLNAPWGFMFGGYYPNIYSTGTPDILDIPVNGNGIPNNHTN